MGGQRRGCGGVEWGSGLVLGNAHGALREGFLLGSGFQFL